MIDKIGRSGRVSDRVFIFIRRYIMTFKQAPSLEDIGYEFNMNVSAVKRCLQVLQLKGRVDWKPRELKTLRITDWMGD